MTDPLLVKASTLPSSWKREHSRVYSAMLHTDEGCAQRTQREIKHRLWIIEAYIAGATARTAECVQLEQGTYTEFNNR